MLDDTNPHTRVIDALAELFLGKFGPTRPSPKPRPMRCMKDADVLCAEQDGAGAESLYLDGVLPDATRVRKEI